MEKKRVKEGESYWYINIGLEGVNVFSAIDFRDGYTNLRLKVGNYFHSKEEAEAMANKIKAVLNGADVIEMPSEKEIDDMEWDLAHKGGYAHDNRFRDFCQGWCTCCNWFKSKIIK